MGGAFLAGVSRKARKFYLGLVALTQNVADFEASAHGRTVLANAALSVLLKHDDKGIDAAEARFRLTPDERQFLLGATQGEGLLFARGSRVRLQSKASPIEHRLVTTNPREIEELAATGHLAPGALLAGAAA